MFEIKEIKSSETQLLARRTPALEITENVVFKTKHRMFDVNHGKKMVAFTKILQFHHPTEFSQFIFFAILFFPVKL